MGTDPNITLYEGPHHPEENLLTPVWTWLSRWALWASAFPLEEQENETGWSISSLPFFDFYMHVLIQSQISFWFDHIQKQLRINAHSKEIHCCLQCTPGKQCCCYLRLWRDKGSFKNPNVSCWDHREEKSYWPDNHVTWNLWLKSFPPWE